jgi:hypothetical protein
MMKLDQNYLETKSTAVGQADAACCILKTKTPVTGKSDFDKFSILLLGL